MRVIISKILNKTDLAQSGSHGGLVVPKSEQTLLKDFFEGAGKDRNFYDRSDSEKFTIRYQDYTLNGTTPNDRVTPIGRYASKHHLQTGDILVFEKINKDDNHEYFIEYIRKISSVFFAGKSKTVVDILNFEQFIDILSKNISDGTIRKLSETEFEMEVIYMGVNGLLRIQQKDSEYELFFDDVSISENKKYFELDTLVKPFILRKTKSWRIAIDPEKEMVEANRGADKQLIEELQEAEPLKQIRNYNPIPEEKAPKREYKEKRVPARSRIVAENALARAKYKCEVGDHETFLRKKNYLPYTEPHHLIPLQFDDLFEYSLDVEANIVSLCSNCHNKIHYGAHIGGIIRKLWKERKVELEEAGLMVMKNGVALTEDVLLNFYDAE